MSTSKEDELLSKLNVMSGNLVNITKWVNSVANIYVIPTSIPTAHIQSIANIINELGVYFQKTIEFRNQTKKTEVIKKNG